MPQPVVKKGDHITRHRHAPRHPGDAARPPVPTPLPYDGVLQQDLCTTVFSQQKAVAVVGSTSVMSPGHIVAPNSFANPPIEPGARVHRFRRPRVPQSTRRSPATPTWRRPATIQVDLPVGQVVASGTVYSG